MLWRSAKAAWLTGTLRPRKATHVMRSGSKRKHQRKVQTNAARTQARAARHQLAADRPERSGVAGRVIGLAVGAVVVGGIVATYPVITAAVAAFGVAVGSVAWARRGRS